MSYNRPCRQRGEIEIWLYSFLNLSTKWGFVVNGTPWPLYPRKREPVPGWVGPAARLEA